MINILGPFYLGACNFVTKLQQNNSSWARECEVRPTLIFFCLNMMINGPGRLLPSHYNKLDENKDENHRRKKLSAPCQDINISMSGVQRKEKHEE